MTSRPDRASSPPELPDHITAVLKALEARRRAHRALRQATGSATIEAAMTKARASSKPAVKKALDRKRSADRALRQATGTSTTQDAVRKAHAVEARVEDLRRAHRRRIQRPAEVTDDTPSQSIRTVSGGLPSLGRRR